MGRFRKLRVGDCAGMEDSGPSSKSMNASTSRVLSPMRNTDIKRAEKTHDWSELMEKAERQTASFRNQFYK